MRSAMPQLAVRSTFIVGYPGETEAEFETLMEFIIEMRFDRVGAFQFSFEPGTSSEPLGDPVPADVKQARFDRLMTEQQGISLQLNQSQVGRELDVLIEGRDRDLGIGRSYRDAPEIDGLVFVEGDARVGDVIRARITGAMPYDLTAVPLGAERRLATVPIRLGTPRRREQPYDQDARPGRLAARFFVRQVPRLLDAASDTDAAPQEARANAVASNTMAPRTMLARKRLASRRCRRSISVAASRPSAAGRDAVQAAHPKCARRSRRPTPPRGCVLRASPETTGRWSIGSHCSEG